MPLGLQPGEVVRCADVRALTRITMGGCSLLACGSFHSWGQSRRGV